MFLAKRVASSLAAQGAWVDYIDPCSGMSMLHHQSCTVYDEVGAIMVLGKYRTQNAGCCKLALHPSWGSWVYPATMFAQGISVEQVEDAMREALEALRPRHLPRCECCGGRSLPGLAMPTLIAESVPS